MHTVFQWGDLMERSNLEDPDVISRWELRCTGLLCSE